MHTCPMVTPSVPPVPHVGGPVMPPGHPTVLIGGRPAATVTNMCVCVGPPDVISQGASTVLINGLPAARMGDKTVHGGVLIIGEFTVLIGGPTTVITGLGVDFDAFAALSPTLQDQIRTLQSQGWTFQYGTPGGGSFADRSTQTITVDPNERGNPTALGQTVSHETGHALYPYRADVSSRNAYVRGALADEGAATLNNIRIQREIVANGGADIGIAGNPANQQAYNNAYNQYERDGNEARARDTIGGIFGRGERTSTTNQPYEDYYGGWYDQNYPPPPRRR
ncbi:PAAR domain-containing protein [Fibrella aestuarina]|nr:PAAR domain-containing protein [Fibrella aestuarina]